MTINVDKLIDTVPGVIEPAGSGVSFTGLMLTNSTRVAMGAILSLTTRTQVKNYFGSTSTESELAEKYFFGYDNSTIKPATLKFWQFNTTAVAAWLRGGSVAAVTLTALQALSGTLTLTVNNETKTTGSIDLSSATSFSNAATIINTALDTAFTTTMTCTYDSIAKAFLITSGTTGDASTITACTGTLAAGVKLDAANATLSQGANEGVFTDSLNAIIALDRNWISFFTSFKPSLDEQLEIADWTNSQNNDYVYIAWDTDTAAINSGSSADLGSLLIALESNGTCLIYGTAEYAAAMSGMVASIDTTRPNGWATLAYKSQSGLAANITLETDSDTLDAKNYNYYGDWASRTQRQNMFQKGVISGEWKWLDDFVGQIYLRDAFQNSALSLLTQINRLPYNEAGYSKLRTVWLGDVINPAIEIGVINAGIALDSTQKVLIDTLAGVDGAGDIVQQTGFYLQITDPDAAVRAARGTPVCLFIYTSGQSIQKLTLPVFNAQ